MTEPQRQVPPDNPFALRERIDALQVRMGPRFDVLERKR